VAKDYYQILGIPRTASKEEVKKAYRAAAHKYHPDKSGGDEAKFKEANEAYQVLGDEAKRAQYDRYGEVPGNGGPQGGAGFGGFPGGEVNFDFGDIFEGVFGGRQGGGRHIRRGNDIAIDVELSFEESVFGAERRINLNKMNPCKKCEGSGSEAGTSRKKCDKCRGSGTIKELQRTFLGTFQQLRECDACHGAGEIPEKPCRDCHGTGVAKSADEVVIRVPAGIASGETMRVTGGGEAASHGVPGDLYVRVRVRPHKVFRRDDKNILMDLDVSFSEVALGGEREIETLDGKIKVKIPAGIDSHEILRLRGKGIPHGHAGSSRGDLLINILVKTPKKISRHARELLESLQKEGM
jgi:molecular chaperone DnaJ